MTLNGVMAVTLCYFTEFGKPHNHVDLWRNLCTSLLYFVVRVKCCRKESSRSLSHLLRVSCLFSQWKITQLVTIISRDEKITYGLFGAPWGLGALGPGPAGPLDRTALTRSSLHCDFASTGSAWPKISGRRVAPTNHSSSQKTRLHDLSYGTEIWTDLSSVLSQCTRLTDEQTDRQTDGRTPFSSLILHGILCIAEK